MRVIYFGQAREAAGRAEENVSLPNKSSVRALIESTTRAHKKLEDLSGVMRVAVNEEVAGEGDSLKEGDVVAFLPPVAGG